MKRKSKKPWPTQVDASYKPLISIIVPTYNEANIIQFKLTNLNLLNYPKNLLEIVIVDSNSSDNTIELVNDFAEKEMRAKTKILVEQERKGKSHALNYALEYCTGEIIIVSDADCFWPSDILGKAIPFLADPSVGAVSGPKILLNSNQTWVTRIEADYLKSANVLREGESKAGSTVFCEGGFSAFKRAAFDKFDAYNTGSDDCGTLVSVIANNLRTMLVPGAIFYSAFPATYNGKIAVKLRRTSQLVRVFGKYLTLIFKKRINTAKKVIIPNAVLYLLSPIAFLFFVALTVVLLSIYPVLLLASVLLVIPPLRFYLFEVLESNFLLFVSIILTIAGRKSSVWSQPEDRLLFTKGVLTEFNLIS
jgi:biofilm PGA synthesis N-glycosyltransferase PgaC